MACVGDCNRSRDSPEEDSPVEKKAKIETSVESKAEKPSNSFYFNGKILRDGTFLKDPECMRQRDLFYAQLEESECFDVDWDSFDYTFNVVNFFWEPSYLDDKMSNEELIRLLIQEAIEEHDELYGTKLEFIKYVSAIIVPVKGFMFHITFWAKDLESSNDEPKAYQAKVRKFVKEIKVRMVRLKPTK